MAVKRDSREELFKDLPTKQVFYFIDDEKNIKVKSREVFKFRNKQKIIHYPFLKKDGSPKYRTCRQVTYVDMPEDLPRGFLKSYATGYGFTKIYNPLIYSLVDHFGIKEIVVLKNTPFKIENGKLFINPSTLNRHYPAFESLIKQHKQETTLLVNKVRSELLPTEFEKNKRKYIPGSLFNYLKRNIDKDSLLSDQDVEALFDLTSFVSHDAASKSANILKTKSKIEEHFIEKVIKEFEQLLKQKTHTSKLEKRWQEFFKKYSWIFSQLFSFPVLIFEDEAYAGGKNIQNKGGKFADFIYKNKLTNNIAFIEIKTHNTSVLEKRAYRGTDVYAASPGLTGALNQVLDQKENFQHELYALKVKTKDQQFESYNPKCLVVIGNVSTMTQEQVKAFELTRSNSKDVEIVTFDEVLEKIKGLQIIMSSST